MNVTESLMARRIYDLERQRDERTFAQAHTFEEWLDQFLRDCDASRVEGPIHCGLGVAGHGG